MCTFGRVSLAIVLVLRLTQVPAKLQESCARDASPGLPSTRAPSMIQLKTEGAQAMVSEGEASMSPPAKSPASRFKVGGANFKVAVLGGAGDIGQPLALLMGMDPNVKELCIADLDTAMVPPEGVAADLNHLESKVAVKGYALSKDQKPIDHLKECLTGCHLVLIPGSVPRMPGMTRDDYFQVNVGIAKSLVEASAKFCPSAVIGMMVNPLNSIVPAMVELYKKKGLDPLKIVGITTLDVMRANKFLGEWAGKNPNFINVPVIGGHSGKTILPLFSQDKDGRTMEAGQIATLDVHVQDAGADVLKAKQGKGSASLSMAYAGARLGKAVLAGLSGRKRTECAYVTSTITDLPYFAQRVIFGEGGVVKVLPLGKLSEFEEKRLEEVKTQLKEEIDVGLKYGDENELANLQN